MSVLYEQYERCVVSRRWSARCFLPCFMILHTALASACNPQAPVSLHSLSWLHRSLHPCGVWFMRVHPNAHKPITRTLLSCSPCKFSRLHRAHAYVLRWGVQEPRRREVPAVSAKWCHHRLQPGHFSGAASQCTGPVWCKGMRSVLLGGIHSLGKAL